RLRRKASRLEILANGLFVLVLGVVGVACVEMVLDVTPTAHRHSDEQPDHGFRKDCPRRDLVHFLQTAFSTATACSAVPTPYNSRIASAMRCHTNDMSSARWSYV